MPYTEDDLIPISALQHALFCERQYALIYLDQIWEENRFTAEGEVLHERVHSEHHESRKAYRQEYDMAVRSLEWGLIGKCDLVELWYAEKGGAVARVLPVEFKRGREKESDVDRVQLCAQALCLEELFGFKVGNGQIYYLQEHRRKDVVFDGALREKVAGLLEKIRVIMAGTRLPAAQYGKRKCDNCSLVEACMPKTAGNGGKDVARYVREQLRLMGADGGVL
jgi:CRISPR-associated exonuclease Cas4